MHSVQAGQRTSPGPSHATSAAANRPAGGALRHAKLVAEVRERCCVLPRMDASRCPRGACVSQDDFGLYNRERFAQPIFGAPQLHAAQRGARADGAW
jgi:hypothetical protein